jgi:hypothetical protein
MPDSYFAFFFLSAKKSNTVAPIPITERATTPDIKIDTFVILFVLNIIYAILKIIKCVFF